jgi:hypothetical protein
VKQHGEGVVRLSLRGKHRGARLKARIKKWQSSKMMTAFPEAYRKPGSLKK